MSDIAQLVLFLSTTQPRKNAKRKEILRFLPALKPEDRCLDIGTAHGGLSHYFSQVGRWTFLERDAEQLKIAKMVLQGNFESSDATQYLKSSPEFHLITFIDTLFYFSNIRETLQLVHRSLEPGGNLVITGIDGSPSSFMMKLRRWLKIELALGIVSDLNRETTEKALREAGFEIVKSGRYFGFFSQLLQSLIDWSMMRPGNKNEDRLTERLNDDARIRAKIYLCKILRPITTLTNALDKILFFLPRYAFVIHARRIS
jgi:2-polyprenyl-3-methyl-5-hydroxy-6-metoxy-1,4-benzoquinol methylase